MKIIYIEFLKLKTKARSWMGPILVFWLILIAYPLTVEFLKEKLVIGFFSVLWIAILISMMFAAEDIFTEDYNDGTLEQTMIVDYSFSLIVGVKIFIYWLFIGIPISLLSFIFSLGTSENLIISLLVLPMSMISSYIFLNINGYFYLDGFYQFLKKIFKIYKKKNINELLSKNYFVLFKDIILIKQICNLNTKTGIPNKNINTNTKSKNILKNTLINKINLPDEIEIVLNRKLINNISFPDLSIKPNILLRNFDKTYLNSYLSSDKYNMDNTNFNYNIIIANIDPQ